MKTEIWTLLEALWLLNHREQLTQTEKKYLYRLGCFAEAYDLELWDLSPEEWRFEADQYFLEGYRILRTYGQDVTIPGPYPT